MDFKQVTRELNRQELEDLMVEAFAPKDAGPFVVENIRTIGNRKEVSIGYMGTTLRRTIVVGAPHEKEATQAVQ
jgi:hypothetical protein